MYDTDFDIVKYTEWLEALIKDKSYSNYDKYLQALLQFNVAPVLFMGN